MASPTKKHHFFPFFRTGRERVLPATVLRLNLVPAAYFLASYKEIAIAWRGFVTFPPFPPFPEKSVPFLNSRKTVPIFFLKPGALEYPCLSSLILAILYLLPQICMPLFLPNFFLAFATCLCHIYHHSDFATKSRGFRISLLV